MESSGVSVVMLPSTYELSCVCVCLHNSQCVCQSVCMYMCAPPRRGTTVREAPNHHHHHHPTKAHVPKHRRLLIDLEQRLLPAAHAAPFAVAPLPLDLAGDGAVAHREDLVAA